MCPSRCPVLLFMMDWGMDEFRNFMSHFVIWFLYELNFVQKCDFDVFILSCRADGKKRLKTFPSFTITSWSERHIHFETSCPTSWCCANHDEFYLTCDIDITKNSGLKTVIFFFTLSNDKSIICNSTIRFFLGQFYSLLTCRLTSHTLMEF